MNKMRSIECERAIAKSQPEDYISFGEKLVIQRNQVERLMTSVIAFVITVDWLRCEANCQTLLGGDDIVSSFFGNQQL